MSSALIQPFGIFFCAATLLLLSPAPTRANVLSFRGPNCTGDIYKESNMQVKVVDGVAGQCVDWGNNGEKEFYVLGVVPFSATHWSGIPFVSWRDECNVDRIGAVQRWSANRPLPASATGELRNLFIFYSLTNFNPGPYSPITLTCDCSSLQIVITENRTDGGTNMNPVTVAMGDCKSGEVLTCSMCGPTPVEQRGASSSAPASITTTKTSSSKASSLSPLASWLGLSCVGFIAWLMVEVAH